MHASGFAHNDRGTPAQITIVGQSNTQTIKSYLLTSFGYKYSFTGQVVAILLGFTVFFGGLAIGASTRATSYHHPAHTRRQGTVTLLLAFPWTVGNTHIATACFKFHPCD